MSERVILLIAFAAAAMAAYTWLPHDESANEARSAMAVDAPAERAEKHPHVAAKAETIDAAPRVFSAKEPLLHPKPASRSAAGKWSTVTVADTEDAVAPRRVGSMVPGKRLSSSKPGDEGARAKLVRDIQYELKRVGCYEGEVHGAWSTSTKRAMRNFTERVNATLPIEEPDYILLTLIESQKGSVCGKGCPSGQVAAADGRCLPHAIVARRQTAPRGKLGKLAEIQPGDAMQAAKPRGLAEPLPGRMSIGAPIAGTSERQEIELDKVRRGQQGAAESKSAASAVTVDPRRREELAALERRRAASVSDAGKLAGDKQGTGSGLAVPASAAAGAVDAAANSPQGRAADTSGHDRRAGVKTHARAAHSSGGPRRYGPRVSARQVFANTTRYAP